MLSQNNASDPTATLRSARWRKSRRSNPSGSCVEVADLGAKGIGVRNSRHPEGPALIYPRSELAAFLTGAKEGDFDDLIGSFQHAE